MSTTTGDAANRIGSEVAGGDAEDARVFLGSRQAVDLLHDAPGGVGLGDHQPLVGGHEVLRLELRERQGCRGQHERRGVRGEAPVVVDEGASKLMPSPAEPPTSEISPSPS